MGGTTQGNSCPRSLSLNIYVDLLSTGMSIKPMEGMSGRAETNAHCSRAMRRQRELESSIRIKWTRRNRPHSKFHSAVCFFISSSRFTEPIRTPAPPALKTRVA